MVGLVVVLLALATASLVLLCAYAALAAWLDRTGARAPRPGERFDAIVVLGCRVLPSGRASPALERRARYGAALYARGHAPVLVLTGGVGEGTRVSEAHAAAEVARAHGVPDEALVLEPRSTSTESNAREAAQVVRAARVLVVTNRYHAFRARRVFARYFADACAVGATGSAAVRVRGALREVGAVSYYLIRGRIRGRERSERTRERRSP